MLYRRSREIEQRLEAVLCLIGTGRYSTPALAEEVGVSVPTISRIVAALRDRGHEIRAERHDGGWAYHLHAEPVTFSNRKGSSDKTRPQSKRSGRGIHQRIKGAGSAAHHGR